MVIMLESLYTEIALILECNYETGNVTVLLLSFFRCKDKTALLNDANHYKQTPLYLAFLKNNKELAQQLLREGADPNARLYDICYPYCWVHTCMQTIGACWLFLMKPLCECLLDYKPKCKHIQPLHFPPDIHVEKLIAWLQEKLLKKKQFCDSIL